MDYSLFAILLMILGLGFVVAELFLPSGGVLTALSIAALAVSMYCAWEAWWGGETQILFWLHLLSLVVMLPVTIGGSLYLLPRTRFGKQVILDAPDEDEISPYTEEDVQLSQLIGCRGETITLLNPGGMVRVEGERIHAVSEGMMIDPEKPVRVMGLKSNSLVVREIDSDETNGVFLSENETSSESESAVDDPPLDFGLTQG